MNSRKINDCDLIFDRSFDTRFLNTKKVYHKPTFSGHSHKRSKIKFPRLLHLTSFGTAKWCVKTYVYGTGLTILLQGC